MGIKFFADSSFERSKLLNHVALSIKSRIESLKSGNFSDLLLLKEFNRKMVYIFRIAALDLSFSYKEQSIMTIRLDPSKIRVGNGQKSIALINLIQDKLDEAFRKILIKKDDDISISGQLNELDNLLKMVNEKYP